MFTKNCSSAALLLPQLYKSRFLHKQDAIKTGFIVKELHLTLDTLALKAVRRWTFRPATRGGQPVESFLRLRVEFSVS